MNWRCAVEPKFAVYSVENGWLKDTCAGGVWTWNVSEAVWYDSVLDCDKALRGGEIKIYDYCYIRVL